jgi:outer membrane immunogenic protein
MKRLLLASLACMALASGSASAADMNMPLKAPLPPAPTWTGCYIDGGGGYGLWNVDHYVSGPPVGGFTTTATTTDGGRGWLGRFGGGCDYQLQGSLSRWVIGAFGDYDFMGLNGSNTPNELFAPAGGISSPITANAKETSAWYVGARVGYLLTPSILTYFDGGYTGTRFTQGGEFQTLTGVPIGFAYPNYNTQGWFLGGGTETALSDWLPSLPAGLFLRTEYRFSYYESRNLGEFSTTTGLPDGNIEHVTPYVQTITTSLVWRFSLPAAPMIGPNH